MRFLLVLPFLAACVDDVSSTALDCDAQRAQFAYERGHAVTIDDDGRVFLADLDLITRFDPDGAIEPLYHAPGAAFDDLAVTPSHLFATQRGVGLVALDPEGVPSQAPALVLLDVAAYGIAADPGGGVYFTRADATRIARWWPGGAFVTDVTAEPLPGPIGDLAFFPDGSLLVMLLSGGDVYRIEVDGSHREISRTLLTSTGLPFSITLDADSAGRLYYGGQGTVYRRSPPYDTTEVLATDVDAFSKLALGRGPNCPADLYLSADESVAITTP